MNYHQKKKQRVLHKPRHEQDEYIDFLDNENSQATNKPRSTLQLVMIITGSIVLGLFISGILFVSCTGAALEEANKQMKDPNSDFNKQMREQTLDQFNRINQEAQRLFNPKISTNSVNQQNFKQNQIQQQRINRQNQIKREKESARKQQLAKTCQYWRTETARNNTSQNRNYRNMACSRR